MSNVLLNATNAWLYYVQIILDLWWLVFCDQLIKKGKVTQQLLECLVRLKF